MAYLCSVEYSKPMSKIPNYAFSFHITPAIPMITA